MRLSVVITVVSIITGCTSSFEVIGYVGGKVIINCTYSNNVGNGNKKPCFYKVSRNRTGSENNATVVDLERSEKKVICGSKHRLLLHDRVNYLRVTFTKLEKEDEGTYECGVENVPSPRRHIQVDLFIKDDSCCEKMVTQTVTTGGEVSISCNYSQDHRESIKYFCKDKAPVCDLKISSGHAELGRFSLSEINNKSFTVTIIELTKEDSGSYWCGVQTETAEGSYIALITKVQLNVKNWKDVKLARIISFHVGQNTTFGCKYPSNHESNDKFLCKGQDPHRCEMIATATREAKERGLLEDNPMKNVFTVYIINLTMEDIGTYWCGSSKTWSLESHTRFDLIPGMKEQNPDVSVSQTSVTPLTTIVLVSVAVPLLLLVILVIIYRKRISRAHGASPTHRVCEVGGDNQKDSDGDHIYEEIHPEQPESGDALLSIYTTANFPTNPSFYATVSYHKNPDCQGEDVIAIITNSDSQSQF